ncbi:MAG: hypothetical protein ABIG89_06455 [Candidatus Woesearchaeota archaeon]
MINISSESFESYVNSKMLASILDHTQLMPFATKDDIQKLCEEAHELGTATVCVNEGRVEDAVEILKSLNSKVKVCAVIGFPLGSCTTEIKATSALDAIKKGAEEIDMVVNVGYLKDVFSKDKNESEKEKALERFSQDIEKVIEAVDNYNAENFDEKNYDNNNNNNTKKGIILKVILENCYLTDEEIFFVAKTIAELAGNFKNLKVFAKTSTGFGVPNKSPVPEKEYEGKKENNAVGATIKDVEIMKKAIDEIKKIKNKTHEYIIGIKAAGGIRDKEIIIKMMIAAGCFESEEDDKNNGNNKTNKKYKLKPYYKELIRIGTSSAKDICK